MVIFLNNSEEVVVTKNMQLSLGHSESISELKLELDFFFNTSKSHLAQPFSSTAARKASAPA